ncbi:hypothetical protein FB451DRAFT_1361744 [Mycena latifolia]|nr:hypothetical protein FB451DRAFT_1361744 [Mycena latifolia]
MGSMISAVGQLFFAWRISIIGQCLFVPALISLVAAVQLGGGVWSGVAIFRAKKFSLLQAHDVNSTALWLSTTALCDVMIVSGTVFYLLKCRGVSFRSTNVILSRIVRASIGVETGLLCAAFAIVDLCLFVVYKGTNYHLAICIELSKGYSNSILLILNSRAHIGCAPPDEATRNISDLIFKSEAGAVSELQVRMNSVKKIEVGSGDDDANKYSVV